MSNAVLLPSPAEAGEGPGIGESRCDLFRAPSPNLWAEGLTMSNAVLLPSPAEAGEGPGIGVRG